MYYMNKALHDGFILFIAARVGKGDEMEGEPDGLGL
jgi:hypothetical protein